MRRRFLLGVALTALSLPGVVVGACGMYLIVTYAQDEDRTRGAVGMGALVFAFLLLVPAAWVTIRLKQR